MSMLWPLWKFYEYVNRLVLIDHRALRENRDVVGIRFEDRSPRRARVVDRRALEDREGAMNCVIRCADV